jgi:hypothetical protein
MIRSSRASTTLVISASRRGEEYFDVSKASGRSFGELFPLLAEDLIETARAFPSAGLLDQKLDQAAA